MYFPTFASACTSLVFSTRCPSCQKPSKESFTEIGICNKCKDSIQTEASITYRGQLRIFAGSSYTSDLSRIILAAKEENLTQARVFLAKKLTHALQKALDEVSINRSQSIKSIVIIPIPSRKSADRRRGFAHIELLVKQLLALNQTLNIQVLNCLSHSRKVSDQTTLNLSERAINMKGAFLVDQVRYLDFYPINNSDSATFLLDDLVTSGATVQAADLALSTLGGRLDGVLASCATAGFTH